MGDLQNKTLVDKFYDHNFFYVWPKISLGLTGWPGENVWNYE